MTNKELFDKEGPSFIGSKKTNIDCSIGLFGVNYDGTTSYKPGARFGPNAIRMASQSLETYCPIFNKDLNELGYLDFGSLSIDLNNTESVISRVNYATKYIIDKNLKPLLFGGEHSITIGVIQALIKQYPDLILLQLDAHADLRDSYLNNKFSHACTMKRCFEILPKKTMFQIGVRSGTKDEFDFMRNNNQLIKFEGEKNIKFLNEKLSKFKSSPIYLTIDLDWFDPSLVPGTGTPEPGGFSWKDFEIILKTLNQLNIVGADIVELAPELDPSGVSNIVAAKVARSLIMTLDNLKKKELT